MLGRIRISLYGGIKMKTICFEYTEYNICGINYFADEDYEKIKNKFNNGMTFEEYIRCMNMSVDRVVKPISTDNPVEWEGRTIYIDKRIKNLSITRYEE
jgi:hypothetical protein